MSNAEVTMAKLAVKRKQLRLLRREVCLQCDQINSRFATQSSQRPSSAVTDGMLAGMFGWRTYYRVRGRERESRSYRKRCALAPLENVIQRIDSLVLQLDARKLQLEQAI